MGKFLNHYDKECMKMAMLKHEETFREQVYELHRLYRIQKMLMKDVPKNVRNDQPAQGFKFQESSGGKCRVSDIEDYSDHGDLELTLGPRSYFQKKIKGDHQSDSGPSFSSSSTGSSHIKGARRDELILRPLSNQDRLSRPPWLLHALSLNIT